jgi:hypothetical protein
MSQKLDSLSKILIATGQINYMAASIDSVNEQIKMIPDENGYHAEGIKQRNELLAETVISLTEIMKKMFSLIVNQDCICTIDDRVSQVPFEILIEGMDDTTKDYEDD